MPQWQLFDNGFGVGKIAILTQAGKLYFQGGLLVGNDHFMTYEKTFPDRVMINDHKKLVLHGS